jgi:hypothetical protein
MKREKLGDFSQLYIQGPETAERTFRVIVNARGWHASFAIPESCFDELTKFLSRHATAENRERV